MPIVPPSALIFVVIELSNKWQTSILYLHIYNSPSAGDVKESCETRQVNSQVNGLHIDGHEYEIVDKLCYLGDMLSQGGCEHAILKRIQTG